MQRTAILTLKALLVVLITVLVACQVWIIPVLAAATARVHPHLTHLQIPGVIVAVVFLACVQVALLCVWQLLSRVASDTIFSPSAFKFVDIILGLIAFDTVLALAVLIAAITLNLSGTATLLCLLGVVLGVGSGLLVFVMRGLIQKATELEQDLSEVV